MAAGLVLAAAVVGCGPAPAARIVLENRAGIDLDVHVLPYPENHRLEILHGEVKDFELLSPLWIDFGMIAHQYDLAPASALGETRVQLQAGDDGRL